ncbi:hypothetical protein ABSDF1779 [Acinetobacter baumannii SDF]|uniref:Uncharacterized protein n=1 Tax=Acinetobacter baumannii (strain SDF) TaxID=509170 RepID=B0VNN8_ACIBS|nr:hypothetical protein [Acinetobacter nosocomialis]MRA12417.1 hypothetical protein [Acinetobacter nosocomialis]CAP01116.1 hypothetical protein ABSDF1779 [Acinetobacter baumannii SDF]
MTPGSVFFDQQFSFHDGESGEKLFVILGWDNGIAIVAKTTSQQHGRGTTFGCQPKDRFHNFYLPQNSCYFRKCTWVCLDEFYELNAVEVLQKRFSGLINPVCNLTNEMLRKLQDCALESDDLSGRQESIIRSSLV